MKVLGIDPGLRNTGWGVVNFENSLIYHVDNGVIRPKVKDEDGTRLLYIFDHLEKIMNFYKPNLIGVEKTFIGEGNVSSLKLGMARGVCTLVAAKSNITIREIPPKLIKKTVTGYGNANKHQIVEMIKKILGITPKNFDSADALAIAVTAKNFFSFEKKFNDYGNQSNLNKAIQKALLKRKIGVLKK